jgi:DNA repair protein RadC
VFKSSILANAASAILFHNHPSGRVNYSHDDLEITKILVKAGEILGITVLDHVIVGDEAFLSFSEEGLIHAGALRKSSSKIKKKMKG